MANQTCMSAMCKCSFGTAPSTYMALPIHQTLTMDKPAANIMDHAPFLNILPFGLCLTITNPMVAAATAAALGVLTPMPCIPATTAPWIIGEPTILLSNMPTLSNTSILMCQWGGVITIAMPGELTVMVP